MLIYYRFSGINAVIALVFNLVILLGMMAYIGAVMTLPGIAGFVLTMGIGVDSNVLIFERIKEEMEAGRSARQAMNAGFSRVFWTLFDIACGISASVFGALINDVVPQSVIGRFYGLFRAAGLIAGIIFFYNVKDHAESGSTWILLGVAALYGGGLTLMSL